MGGIYDHDDLEFTANDLNVLYDTVDSKFFRTRDSALIYAALQKKLIQRPFGDYLKRYIFRKAGLSGNWRDVPLNDYRKIIVDSFEDNNTPASFAPTTAKLSALSKNWLTQSVVKRQVVFLLGFGLRMCADDVSSFLIRALHERDINPKNPFELICWYCYQHQYGFSKYLQLKELFERAPANTLSINMLYGERTVGIRSSYANIHDDAVLLSKLSQMKTSNNQPLFSFTARQHFDSLYLHTRELIASYYNHDEREKLNEAVFKYLRENEYNPRLCNADKQKHIEKMKSEMRVYSANDITAGDVEKVICAAIPTDKNGNLSRGNLSTLNRQFSGHRFSRQHIADILLSKIDIDRFDLITLNFYLFSQETTEIFDAKSRFLKFIDDTNRILVDCSMGELLTSNPYECFIMMCMLSEDPLGTYADVLEMSYTLQPEK